MRWLVILGSQYKEVEGKDWWDAQKVGARYFKKKTKTTLPHGLVGKLLKVVSLEGKYTKEEIDALLAAGNKKEKG